MNANEKNLFSLFLPICFETLLYMMTGMVDTLMLSTLGDSAVGAVGTANTYISVFILMFSIVSTGAMAVMTQNLGAGQSGTVKQVYRMGLLLNACLGIGLSLFLGLGAGGLLAAIGISQALEAQAMIYIRIVGGTCFLNALIAMFSVSLRSFGNTQAPLWATLFGNAVNMLLNGLFLFVFRFGVAGVAAATALSKVANLLPVYWASQKQLSKIKETGHTDSQKLLLQIFRVGFPSAVETMLYNLALTFAIRFLNQMDSTGFQVSARSYTAQIATFSFAVGAALAQANAILTGWRVGRKEYDLCERKTKETFYCALAVSLFISCLIAFAGNKIVRWFTSDPQMCAIVCRLLWIDVVLELGRTTNMIYGNALKTCGDAVFPVIIGILFMFVCTVFGTWYLGIRCGLLVTGCYIALASDECTRAVAMILRWKSGKWKGRGLV